MYERDAAHGEGRGETRRSKRRRDVSRRAMAKKTAAVSTINKPPIDWRNEVVIVRNEAGELSVRDPDERTEVGSTDDHERYVICPCTGVSIAAHDFCCVVSS